MPRVFSYLIAGLICLLLGACSSPPANDADVIVTGGGIAGLSAAIEAATAGASVIVLEANSVAGGHAVKAGGFALVDTALQRARGLRDSPDIAFTDLMTWGETANPEWVQRYVEQSGTEVYDWLTAMGVKFQMVLDTPEDTVPRFHFTRGTAVNVIVPMLRQILQNPRIELRENVRVTGLIIEEDTVRGVMLRDERTGAESSLRAPAVVLTTGGFESSLQQVRDNWPHGRPAPPRLLIGSGQYAQGDGYRLAAAAGAAFSGLDRQVTFTNGVPDPHDPAGERGFTVQNPRAIWVDSAGERFVNENANSKAVEQVVLEHHPDGFWMIFDAEGRRKLQARDSLWLNSRTLDQEVLGNAELTATGDSIASLAQAAKLPPDRLQKTVERFNRMAERGLDSDFGRFDNGQPATLISQAPFYALHLYPLTRKSMGGPEIDTDGHVLDQAGKIIPGLYAAGELTGVAGINGNHGGSGTFLGPSVLTGRIAGRAAAALRTHTVTAVSAKPIDADAGLPDGDSPPISLDRSMLEPLLATSRDGYWHFESAHRLVRERGLACGKCHSASFPPAPTATRAAAIARTATCTVCH